jgi:rubrerythrin
MRAYRAPGSLSLVARYLAKAAYLERASVTAFVRLAEELAAHGAPTRLRRAALRAARDEILHARIVARLAERAGAPSIDQPRVRAARVRSLAALAIENAVEGCVYETFGAAVGLAQAMTASDAKVRAAMRRIARDEMQHAELA